MSRQDMLIGALDRVGDVRVLVVGDVMLDVYEFCLTSASKPIDSEKPGKRAYQAQTSIKVLGGAGNVAANLASLGAGASLVGLTGNDENYFKIREIADAQGIRHFLVRDASRPTTTKIRLYLDHEYLLRRDDESTRPVDAETSATLLNEVLRELPEVDVVVLSDYSKGVFTAANAQQIVKECRLHAVPVVVDFKPANRAFFVGADLISPNAAEAAVLVPGFAVANLAADCRRLHELLGCRSTVVTLGEHGLCACDGEHVYHTAGHAVPAVDAVGCGDTVRAGLALGCALGLSLDAALELANCAGAVIVQKPVTARMTRDELVEFIRTHATSTVRL